MGKQERMNILLVDDRRENLLALERLLGDQDLNLVKATSGNEALSLALEYEFALVLMDVQMPDMDGFETAELMRGADDTKHIPIIFVTAISKERRHVFKGYESGAVDYLFKPLDPDILLAKVATFLELHRQKTALLRANESLREANRKILDQQKTLIEEERLKVLLQMAGATAHELNQPLMALLGSIEMMAFDRDDPKLLFTHTANVKKAGERIAEIVKKIQTIRRDETMPYAGDLQLILFNQKVKVLSIEDSLTDFLAIQSLLQEEGAIELHHAPDLDTAIREIEETPYDIILVDHILGEDTGEDFLREAANKGIEIPTIVVTGKGDELLASRMIQAGASGYLPKSELSRNSLTREIFQALEKARLRQEVRRAQEKLADMSTKDSLTNLYNRRYFTEILEREFSRAERYDSGFSLCMMDLDRFKAVNDTHGHPAGDTVLKEAARLLSSSFRKGDLVCRFGGEEFAAILHRAGKEEARIACEAFRKKLESVSMEHEGALLRVTVSIGIQAFEKEKMGTPEEMMRLADNALYRAKDGGRNRVVVNT
jgi:two-component system cell cycle response regulator